MSGQVTIRRLDESSLDTMLDWAAAEGWNPGLGDSEAFLAADPGGFLGLFLDDELTVTISAVRYDAHYGFVGFYICKPEHRGQGLGLRLFEAALAAIDATTVGLDGVVEQEPNYARSGFVTAYRNVRFGGRPNISPVVDARVRALRPDDLDAMVLYEHTARVFPVERRRFLERWLAVAARGVAVGDTQTIDGYGVIRRCRSGHKIGPLFCNDAADAELLVGALLGAIGGGDHDIFLDVPQPNTTAMRLARDIGLVPTFETVRMYRGPEPTTALDRVFGVTTFELG